MKLNATLSLNLFSLLCSLGMAFWPSGLVARELPLIKLYPSLQAIPHLELLKVETPIAPLANLERELKWPQGSLWIKRDDRSDELLGGNKARKLEFLLGPLVKELDATKDSPEARRQITLVTTGMWGSNHALATAIVGHLYGLRVVLQLGPQLVTEKVKEKLLAFHALGAQMQFFSHKILLGFGIVGRTLQDLFSQRIVYFPPGGSEPLGNLGYIDAYMEMMEQYKRSGSQLPQEIYLPMGTAGTSAGLWIGSCLSGTLETVTIHAIGISHDFLSNGRTIERMARKSYRFLRDQLSVDDRAKLPDCQFKLGRGLVYHKEFSAPGYGKTKKEVFATMDLVKKKEGIVLDQTYTGKAFDGMIQLIEGRPAAQRPSRVLYWHTYNSYSLQDLIVKYPWTDASKPQLDLPNKFRALF